MGFQPFGYRFEVSSRLPPAETKALIRSKKTRIFDAKNGARGWIAGPFICLWFSAFDRYGPMLFGLISSDNLGTRVHGRAGSDLNGVLMFTLLFPLMGWLVFKMISEGQATGPQLLIIALVFLVGGPLMYWWAHKERKDAEPLVRFLRKSLAEPAASSRATATTTAQRGRLDMGLILNGDRLDGPVTLDALQSALMRVGNRDHLIIEESPQHYMQTALRAEEYVLEVRKGGPAEHYQAVRSGSVAVEQSAKDDAFTFEEIVAAMAAYLAGEPSPSFLRWQPLDLPT